MFLSFFTFTVPRAAGTTDDVKKLIFLVQETNENSITIARMPKKIFGVLAVKIVAFILAY